MSAVFSAAVRVRGWRRAAAGSRPGGRAGPRGGRAAGDAARRSADRRPAAQTERFDTLIERLRLTVLSRGGRYVELRQARLRPNGRAGLFDADLATLDGGAGVAVEETLLANGAQTVGTREELLGDAERTRARVGARIAREGEDRLPVVAYVLTRVAPVANDVSA